MLPLEALRGVAAIVVVAHHFVQSFVPRLQGPNLLELGPAWLVGTPLELFLNGPAAVIVFYAITGFVLTTRAFADDEVRLLPVAAKRWPRLAGPVLVAVLFSYALFVMGMYQHREAGALNHSVFLGTFFDQMAASPPGTVFEPSFWGALFEGSIGTFLYQQKTYDPVIWMVHTEWMGSLVAVLFAADLRGLVGPRILRIPLRFVLVLAAVFYPAFFGGVVVARLFALGRLRLPRGAGLVSGAVALYLLGAASPWGVYAWVAPGPNGGLFVLVRGMAHAVGAILLLVALLGTVWSWAVFRGRVSRLLGMISFPLFLVHLLVFGSVGARTYLAMKEVGAHEAVAVFVTLVASLAACVPLVWALARFDVWWVAVVNRTVERLWPARAPRGVRASEERPAEAVAAGERG